MNCEGCRYNPQDWRLCLYPNAENKGFWDDPQNYSCKMPALREENQSSPTHGPTNQREEIKCST